MKVHKEMLIYIINLVNLTKLCHATFCSYQNKHLKTSNCK